MRQQIPTLRSKLAPISDAKRLEFEAQRLVKGFLTLGQMNKQARKLTPLQPGEKVVVQNAKVAKMD